MVTRIGQPVEPETSAPGARRERRDIALEDLTEGSPPSLLAAARELLLEYGRFVQSRPEVGSFCYGSLEREAAALPHSYLLEQGGCMLALVDTRAAGFVAWRSLPASASSLPAWELKRLWLRPEARGAGAGRALMLDTAPAVMVEAYSLYAKMGFLECPPYNGAALPGIVYMRKTL
jgi:GNAT superfamily N-acetyltransferase